jgi:phosphoenolpyruvate carboxykinase (diphosphate)
MSSPASSDSLHQRQTVAARLPPVATGDGAELGDIVSSLIAGQYREKERLLANHLCPADQRIQTFLYDYLQDVPVTKLPRARSRWTAPGWRACCRCRWIAMNSASEHSSIPTGSSRACCTIPGATAAPRRAFSRHRRRPADSRRQIGVPKAFFGKCCAGAQSAARNHAPAVHRHAAAAGGVFRLAAAAPARLPGSSRLSRPEKRWKSGFSCRATSSATSISSKAFWQRRRPVPAGKRRRAGHRTLDRPHRLRHPRAAPDQGDQEIRRPAAWDQATERQRRDGMCWKDEWEFYNNGGAFKLTCRDETGVIVTIIADNYYGYCKKEVKTQISYAANLFGLRGGARGRRARLSRATIWARNSAATCTSSAGPFLCGGDFRYGEAWT